MKDTVRLRHLAEINPPTPAFDNAPLDAPMTFMPLETVWADSRVDLTRKRPKSEVDSGYVRFLSGDILCPKVTPTFQAGRSSLIPALDTPAGAASTEVHVVRARMPISDPRFIRYCLLTPSFLTEGVSAFQGVAGLQRVPQEFLADLAITDLSLTQQRRIADFLDDQVACIDNIIAARRAQRALIQECTRRELDTLIWYPRDSAPLKRFAESITSGPRGWGDRVGDVGTPFLRIANLPKEGVSIVPFPLARVEVPDDAESRRATLQFDDVLLGITASLGDVGLVTKEYVGATFSQHVARIRPQTERTFGTWLAWVLQTPRVREHLVTNGYGGTKVGLGLAEVADVHLPVVSVTHQEATVGSIEKIWAQSAALGETQATFVDRMTELKCSLITAAVTGEFDVSTADGSQVLAGVSR